MQSIAFERLRKETLQRPKQTKENQNNRCKFDGARIHMRLELQMKIRARENERYGT